MRQAFFLTAFVIIAEQVQNPMHEQQIQDRWPGGSGEAGS